MAFRRGMQAIEGFGDNADCRLVTEGDVGGAQIVVNGLGHPHHRLSLFKQALGDLQGAVAADRDQDLGTDFPDIVQHLGGNVAQFGAAVVHNRVLEGIAPVAGAQDGAAPRQDAAHGVEGQFPPAGLSDQAVESVFNTEHPPAVSAHSGSDHAADDCVQTGAVPAPGKNGNGSAHDSLLCFRFPLAGAIFRGRRAGRRTSVPAAGPDAHLRSTASDVRA